MYTHAKRSRTRVSVSLRDPGRALSATDHRLTVFRCHRRRWVGPSHGLVDSSAGLYGNTNKPVGTTSVKCLENVEVGH